jgi:hypothetical protein
MTVIGALSSFRELGKMSPHKRVRVQTNLSCGQSFQKETDAMPTSQYRSRLGERVGDLAQNENSPGDVRISRKCCVPRWVRSGKPDIGLEVGVWEWTSGGFGRPAGTFFRPKSRFHRPVVPPVGLRPWKDG